MNVVGLTERLLNASTPRITAFVKSRCLRRIQPVLPGVTCSAQSTYLTGTPPSEHGIVANGWYDRELAEVHFWKQSNHLVRGRKLWEEMRAIDPSFTCAKLFWWYNMYSSADYSVTPRPSYPADGRKIFDIYSWPYELRPVLKQQLGDFPFPGFWGPAAGVSSAAGTPDCATRWIADCARRVEELHQPTLNLVYLPHLDYNLQRWGPTHPSVQTDLMQIDSIVGDLIQFFESRGVGVVLLSEYGIVPVEQPVHLNRVLRSNGWLTIKEELGLELLDAGNSRAFAVADHQLAHVYIREPSLLPQVRRALEKTEGVDRVLDRTEQTAFGLQHARSGDLVVLSKANAWFTYYYWMEDSKAPDFARCVDIHRKPGYDPVELFLDPKIAFPKARIAWRLLKKNLGFRMLMDVIPLDATLVKGSHGVCPSDLQDYPILVTEGAQGVLDAPILPTDVYGHLRDQCLRF